MQALLDPLQFAILPVFAFTLIGFILGRRGAFSRAAAEGTNAYVVGIAVPCILFMFLGSSDLSSVDWPVLIVYEMSLLILYGFGYLFCRFVFRLAPIEALLVGMTGAFPNHVFFVMPIAVSLYGPDAGEPIATMIAVDTLIMFAGTVMVLEAMTGGAGPLRTLGSIARNRLIIAIFGGLAFNLSGFEFHDGVAHFLGLAAASAAPASLFALGVILSGSDLSRIGGPAWTATVIKVGVHPLIAMVLLGTAVPVSAAWEGVAQMVFAAPCGAMAFVLGLRYGVPVENVAKAIILSTIFSVFAIALIA
ncbi:MAG: AEC family transporter [Pseudomonadota bacterium]